MEYNLEELEDRRRSFGVIKYFYYKVVNYDGNEEKLKQYVSDLNKDSCFNIDYYIKEINDNEVIIEEVEDTLD